MRIEELTHEGFGPAEAARLAFGGGWTLIHAPNEAGKSSLLRAIRAALFDVPPAKAANGKQPARAASVEARLRAADGRAVRVLRSMDAAARKKARAKFVSELRLDDEPADADAFEELLGLSPSVAERLLTVAHEDLIEGAGRLGRLDDLFEIDALNRLSNVRDRIDKQLTPLRPKNSKVAKSDINVALREIAKADEELQGVVLTPEAHRDLMRRREELQRAAEAADREADGAEAEAARLAALRKAGPPHAERAVVRERIAAAAAEPLPRERAVAIVGDWRELTRLRESLKERREERRQAEEELGRVAQHSPLDEVAEDVRRLAEGRDAVAGLREAATEARQAADAARRELDAMDDVPEVAAAGLAEQIDDWQAAIDAAERQVAADEQAHSHAAAELDQLRDRGDADGDSEGAALIASAAAAVAAAPERDAVAARRREADRQTEELQAAWRSLAGRAGWASWPAETPRLPTRALALEAQAAEKAAADGLRDAESEAARSAKAVREAEADVAAAAAEGTSVTPQDRDAARAERDAAVDAAAGASDLPAALDRVRELTAAADDAADALFENATQVAKVADAAVRLERVRKDHAAGEDALAVARDRAGSAAAPLAERWAACGAEPLGPAETLEWLEELESLTERQSRLRAEEDELERDERAVSAAASAAAEAMAAAGVRSPDPTRWVREEAKRLETAAALRERDAAQLPAAEKAVRVAEESLARSRSRHEAAAAALAAGLLAAGLGEGLSARQAKRAAERAAKAAALRSEAAKQTAAAEAAEARVAAYDADADRVLAALAAEPATASLRTVAEAVEAERVRVGERAAWQKQEEVVRRAKAAEENVSRQAAEVEARLPEPSAVGREDLDGVRRLAEESLEVHSLRDREAGLGDRIAAFRVGEPAAFEEALSGGDEESWRRAEDAALAAKEGAVAAARAARAEASEITGQLQAESADTQAATIAGILEAARTDLREAVDRYAPLQILSTLLGRAGEETRDAGADLLEGVGQILSAATGGRHTGVERDKSDRLSVRGPTGGRSPAELSDGTRDLLYLAVRLEFARRRAASAPLPLLLDDVLVRVSEDRQPPVLATLAALGRDMQVILLTCQKRTADLAAGLPEADRPAVLTLG